MLLAKTSWPQCIIYLASWIGQEGFNPYPHYQLFQEIRWYIFAVMHGLPFLKIFAQLTSKISFFQYQIIYDLEKLLEIYLPHWQFYLSLAILKIAFDNTELAVSIIFHSITGAGCWNLVLRKTRTCLFTQVTTIIATEGLDVQHYCHALCKILKWLSNWNKNCELRFHKIWLRTMSFKDISYTDLSQIPQCIDKNPIMHHFGTEMCPFLLQNGAL